GRATWRPAHRRWLSAGVWPPSAPQSVCHASVRAGTDHPARLARLAPARTDQGQPWRLAPVSDALQALRGGQGPVAVTTGADRGAPPRVGPRGPAAAPPGLPPLGRGAGGGAPTGRPPQAGQGPGPPCPGRRRWGLALPRQKQPASALTPGDGPPAAPR